MELLEAKIGVLDDECAARGERRYQARQITVCRFERLS
jgi:hypothetical protein